MRQIRAHGHAVRSRASRAQNLPQQIGERRRCQIASVKIRLECDRRVVFFDRLVEAPEILQDDAEIIEELSVTGIDAARLLVEFHGLLGPVRLLQHQSYAAPGASKCCGVRADALQQFLHLLITLELYMRQRQVFAQKIGNCRRQFVGALEFVHRPLASAVRLQDQTQIEMGGCVGGIEMQRPLVTRGSSSALLRA